MREREKDRVPKTPHKVGNATVFTEEQIAQAKRRITQRRRAIEDERIDREVEERLK